MASCGINHFDRLIIAALNVFKYVVGQHDSVA